MNRIKPFVISVTVLGLLAALAGCGFLADKDRIVVASVDGKKITRGDLAKYIREMPDEERPLIQNKTDLLATLNAWINIQVGDKVADQLHKEGKIDVPRDAAKEIYFTKHAEFRNAARIKDPAQLNMSQGDLNAILAEIEFGTDEQVTVMMRDEAVKYLVKEGIRNKTLPLTQEDIDREYERRKNELIKFEYTEFIALQFPLAMPNAIELAGDARRRIDAGETFDNVVRPWAEKDANFRITGALENNPSIERFKSFWEAAHGATIGQIVGPVLMPEHDEYKLDPATKKTVQTKRPAAQIVLQVIKHEPERVKTLAEAANELATGIAKERIIERIRAEHNVEVYFEKLPDPAGVGDQYKNFMIDTSKPSASSLPQ